MGKTSGFWWFGLSLKSLHVWIPDDGNGIIHCSGQNGAALIEDREKFLPDSGFFLCLWTFPIMCYPFSYGFTRTDSFVFLTKIYHNFE